MHDDLVRDVHAQGLMAVLANRGREVVRLGWTRPGQQFADLVAADPHVGQSGASGAVGPSALGAESETRASSDIFSHRGFVERLRDQLRDQRRDHPDLREGDGSPIQYVARAQFDNWGRTVHNVPAATFIPRTKSGVMNLVRWTTASGHTVRAAGYRHSWSDVFSADDQVLVSLLPLYDVDHLPAPEPPIDPGDELQGIDLVGTVEEDGVTKALCRIGAATTNEQFRRWCLDNGTGGGGWAWTIPLNVIMVEITWGGSNAPICHGAGRRNPTLSDLVTEVEFVNAKGELQVVSDPELLRSAAGCFGLLGIVTAITLKLDPMSYARLRPQKQRLALAVPPPVGFTVPRTVDMSGISDADLEQARTRFVDQCENDYYAEWFWFPYQADCWVNCWRNDGDRAHAKPYPGDWWTLVEQTEEYLAELAAETVFRLLPARIQAEVFGALAMANLPSDEEEVVTPLIEALHFRRGIQNFRVLDMELEIPVPPRAGDPSRPDWSICQRAWWDALTNVLSRPDAPMRVALEMRIMGGSNVTMAPQYGNDLATCSIEVLTTPLTPRDEWDAFMQDIADLWMSYTDPDGNPLNVRPHWAKQWESLQLRGRPAVEYLRAVAYEPQLPKFRADLESIAVQGGYELKDLRLFGNPLFAKLFPEVFV